MYVCDMPSSSFRLMATLVRFQSYVRYLSSGFTCRFPWSTRDLNPAFLSPSVRFYPLWYTGTQATLFSYCKYCSAKMFPIKCQYYCHPKLQQLFSFAMNQRPIHAHGYHSQTLHCEPISYCWHQVSTSRRKLLATAGRPKHFQSWPQPYRI